MLLILATVAISMAVDSNGLFKRAEYAAETWNDSVRKESSAIENAMLIMNEIGGGSTSDEGTEPPVEEVEVQSVTLNTQSIIIEVDGSEKLIATVLPENATNKEVKWSSQSDGIARVEDGTVTGVSKGNTIITATAGVQSATCNVKVIELPEGWNSEVVADVVEEGSRKAPIPKGYTASQIPGEDKISDGLVIYEGADPVTGEKDGTEQQAALTSRNQYVWIPVDDINDMVMCQKHPNDKLDTETALCTTCKENTLLAGKLYTGIQNGSTAPQLTFNANSGRREPAVVTGNSTGDGTQYDGAINESFGLGIAEVFLAHLQKEFSNMAKSVAKYKGFYISRYEIQAGAASKKGATVLCNDSESNNWYGLYTTIQNSASHESTIAQMIWGSQYDQVMKFVDEKPDGSEAHATFDVQTASATRKRSSGEVSGNNPADLVCNIYDLENNYYEWTAEAHGTNHRVSRGRLLRH